MLSRFKAHPLAPLAMFAALVSAPLASGQTVDVSIQGPTTAAPGETVTITVTADVTGLPASGAFGGFGLDLDVTSGSVAGFSTASINPVLNLGRLPGTPDGVSSLNRVVGGQLMNVFGFNPDVNQSTSLTLFSTELTIDPAAQNNSSIVVSASPASGAGIVLYGDITSGASLRLPGAPGTTLNFTDLTIVIEGGSCPGDTDGDGEVNLADLNLVLANFGQNSSDGDTNGDGVVDLSDLNVVLAAFGTSCGE
jgi:hypothetical protein